MLPVVWPTEPGRRKEPPATRPANKLKLRDAISKVSGKKPLSVREIVEAVQKLGYQFQSSNPVNSVGAFLYGPSGKKHFKRMNGKFAPIGASKNGAAPTKAKRTMSPAARKRIAAARARWAAVKAKKK
jgi:hypothetical protein